MRCNTARQYMMDRLFDELPQDQITHLEKHLQTCPVCAAEWQEVQKGHAVMKKLDTPEIPSSLQIKVLGYSYLPADAVPAESRHQYRWWLGMAASFLLVFLSGVWMADYFSLSGKSGNLQTSLAYGPLHDESVKPQERFNTMQKPQAPAVSNNPVMERVTETTGFAIHKTDKDSLAGSIQPAKPIQPKNENQPAVIAQAPKVLAGVEMKIKSAAQPISMDQDILITVPPHPDDIMIKNPGPHPDDKMIVPKYTKNIAQSLKQQPQPESKEKYAVLELNTNEEAKTELAATKPVSEKSAREYFQTAMKLYNTAFTKTGDEQKSLLQSAVIFLNDLESKFPSESKWLAMAIILKADAHKQLGQNAESIATYQSLIRRFYKVEPFCEQARVSIVQLLINDNQSVPNAIAALDTFHRLYPKSGDYPKVAFAVAETVKNSSPEITYTVCKEIMNTCEQPHPVWNKANILAQSVQEQIKNKFAVSEYWFLGPMPEETGFHDITPFRPEQSYNNNQLKWTLNKFTETGLRDNSLQWPAPDGHQSLFACTSVFSNTDQTVNIIITRNSNVFCLWINGEAVYADQGMTAGDFIQPAVRIHKGWNDLLVKTIPYPDSKSWNFNIQFLDDRNQILANLKVDPTMAGKQQ